MKTAISIIEIEKQLIHQLSSFFKSVWKKKD